MRDTRREERRHETCEVFTPQETVAAMLAKLPDSMFEANKTFLDNSCGNGNMLVGVLMEKLAHAPEEVRHYGSGPAGETLTPCVSDDYVTACVKSLFGTDMMEDNIIECRERLVKIAIGASSNPSDRLGEELREIVSKQIVCTRMEDWDYERWCPDYEKLF